MSNKRKSIIWGLPEGEAFYIESKTDLVDLINKMGISDPEMTEDVFGYSITTRQMSQEELDESGIEFDPEYPEDTEMYNVDKMEDEIYVAPIFRYNEFLEEEDQVLSKRPLYNGSLFTVKEKNVVLNEDIYKFPCFIYGNLQKSHDRTGSLEVRVWNVTPLSEINKVKEMTEFEEKSKNRWVENTDNLDRVIEAGKNLRKQD